MTTPPAISMTPSELAGIKQSLAHLSHVVGAASGRPLLNDAEAAAWLGYTGENPTDYMIWLRHNLNVTSVKLGKLRRWRVTDLEKFVNSLPEKSAAARKPRLKKSA